MMRKEQEEKKEEEKNVPRQLLMRMMSRFFVVVLRIWLARCYTWWFVSWARFGDAVDHRCLSPRLRRSPHITNERARQPRSLLHLYSNYPQRRSERGAKNWFPFSQNARLLIVKTLHTRKSITLFAIRCFTWFGLSSCAARKWKKNFIKFFELH